MKLFHKSTIGESHIKSSKPCQDYSLTYQSDDSSLSVILVSDGHGGEPYFRSHIGSKLVCDIALEAIKNFVENMGISCFEVSGKHAIKIPPIASKDHSGKFDNYEAQLRQLSKTIISNWRKAVEENVKESAITEREQEYAKDYLSQLDDPDKVYRVYGCTLIAFVVTSSCWFAIHLGDGKCIAFYDQTSDKVWDEPIPWDERCFLNKTTSICANDAYENFRFSYGGLQSLPIAVFLGSDGIDDTFSDSDSLCDFYIKVLKEILFTSQQDVESELELSLPILSKRGSLDDMSVACIYDEQKLIDNIKYIINHQISLVNSRIDSSNRRIQELVSRKQDLEQYLEIKERWSLWNKTKKELETKLGVSPSTNIKIEMDFADKDIIREKDNISQLSRKQESLVNDRDKAAKLHNDNVIKNDVTVSSLDVSINQSNSSTETSSLATEIDENAGNKDIVKE